MLCLNCIHARDEVPAEVEVEKKVDGEVVTIDIADMLAKLRKSAERRGYTAIIFCSKLKEIKVGAPPSPAKTITECEEFTEA